MHELHHQLMLQAHSAIIDGTTKMEYLVFVVQMGRNLRLDIITDISDVLIILRVNQTDCYNYQFLAGDSRCKLLQTKDAASK